MQEIFSSVTYYGIGEIIKEYAGFPHFLPLPVSIQHGWSTEPTAHDARNDAPENWYWAEHMEEQYQKYFTNIRTRTVGAPFLYLLENLDYSVMPECQRAGSIVFPSHSSALIKMECDFDKYAEMLAQLPDSFKPITICMYHLDHKRGLEIPFARKGFKIVTNGSSLYEATFLKNFVYNVQDKLYAFSNQMTSALLYASAMGLTSFFYGPQFRVNCSDPNYQHLDCTQYLREWEDKYRKYFRFPNCDRAKQRRCIIEELGSSSILSRQKMSAILWQLTLTKTYARVFVRRVGPVNSLPRRLYRMLQGQVKSRNN